MSYLHLSSAYSFSGPIFDFPREAKHSFSKFGYFGSSFSIIILYFKIILSLPLSRVGNTDAEGRMVMVDVLCKVRDRFLEYFSGAGSDICLDPFFKDPDPYQRYGLDLDL